LGSIYWEKGEGNMGPGHEGEKYDRNKKKDKKKEKYREKEK
jgi:hypothetical protein